MRVIAKLRDALKEPPRNMYELTFCEPYQAMFDDVKNPHSSLIAYHDYYIKYKQHLQRMDKTNNTALDDPEPQRYYDWMLWKMRTRKAKEPVVMTTEEMMKKGTSDMQSNDH